MRRLLKYIFIPIFGVLLMSHNVFAVDMSPNVHPIWSNANPTCAFYNSYGGTGGQWVNNSFSNNSDTQNVTYSIGKINCDYPSGLQTLNTYAVYSFRFDNYNYNDSADSGWLATKAQSVSGSANWGVIGQTVSAMGSTGYQIDIYLYGQASTTGGGTFQLYNPLNIDEIFYLKPKERVTFVGASYWAITAETDFEYNYTDVLNTISSNLINTQHDTSVIRTYTYNSWQRLGAISDKLDDTNEHYQKEEQAADNISNQSPSNIGNSENTATTNLVSALSGFITTIANAPATNCLINGDLGNLDIGSIDLCQGKEHFSTLVEFIGFTALFGVVFWASYHLIKKTLALIDWARSK